MATIDIDDTTLYYERARTRAGDAVRARHVRRRRGVGRPGPAVRRTATRACATTDAVTRRSDRGDAAISDAPGTPTTPPP